MEPLEKQLEKEKFLKDEAWTLSWNGAVRQVGKVWSNPKDAKRN